MKLGNNPIRQALCVTKQWSLADLIIQRTQAYFSLACVASCLMRFVLATLLLVLPLRVLAAGEQPFATPEAAVSALEMASKHRDTNALHAIFGPVGRDLVSPDAV